MPSATENDASPAKQVPAWKRLGLKLKSAPVTQEYDQSTNELGTPKRKRSELSTEDLPFPKTKKIPRTSSNPVTQAPITPKLSRKKSVTFTPETKAEDGDSIKQLYDSWVAEQRNQDPSFELKSSAPVFNTPEPVQVAETVDSNLDEKERRVERVKKAKPEKTGKVESRSKLGDPTASPDRPYLQYLRQYCESRETWKFNKNHQNHLLKHAFDLNTVPSDHAHFLYEYVRNLQGGVRTRLRDVALQLKVKDQEDGPAGFPNTMSEKEKEKYQQDYERVMREYVAKMTTANDSKQIGYEENVLHGLSNSAMASRTVKRIRSEQILAELGATNESTAEVGAEEDDSQKKRLRLNDGSTQKLARKRKQRTVVDDDSSSSESSSSSDEDSSSEDESTTARNDDDTSSSSSSSSSSSDSEDSEEEETEEESDDNESD